VLVVPLVVVDVAVVAGPLVARLVEQLQEVELVRLVEVILLEEDLLHREVVLRPLPGVVLLEEE